MSGVTQIDVSIAFSFKDIDQKEGKKPIKKTKYKKRCIKTSTFKTTPYFVIMLLFL